MTEADLVIQLSAPMRGLSRIFTRDGRARIYTAVARKPALLAEVIVTETRSEGRSFTLTASDGTVYEGQKARCACGSPLKRLNMESAWA